MITMKSGNDIGNGYTKYKDGKKFASKIRVGTLATDVFGKIKRKAEVHQIVYKGIEYVVGEGSSFVGDNRYTSKEYALALLTSLALQSKGKDSNITASVVVGVPLTKQKTKAEVLQNYLKSLGVQEITVDGIDYVIELKDVTVFVEGAYPIYAGLEEGETCITIDIGAGTVNIAEWDGETIVNRNTLNEAFNRLCGNIVKTLNEKYSLDLNLIDGEKYVGAKTISIDGKEVAVPELDVLLDEFIAGIIPELQAFHLRTCKHVFVFGGGAKATITNWKKQIPHATLVQNAQFVNQKVYETVAEVIYSDEE